MILDFIALRTEFADYAKVFSKTVEDYAFSSASGADDDAVAARIAAYHARLHSLE